MRNPKLVEAFRAVAELGPVGQCWEWSGTRCGGYGRFFAGGSWENVHRLSYETFKGDIPPGALVRHRCDNPPCWNPDHLLVGSYGDNARDMVDRGRQRGGFTRQPNELERARGVRNGASVLTDADVVEIRRRCKAGESQHSVATHFGVTRPNIGYIVRRKTWAHVL